MTVIVEASRVLGADSLSSIRPALKLLAGLAPELAASLVILLTTYAVSRLASGRLRQTLTRGGFQVNVAILLARTLWIALWILGFLLILNLIGVGFTPLAAVVGVVGLAASLSLQAVLQNLVAGIYLLAERPFEIGDYIAVVAPNGVNHEGTVEDIEMRTTHMRSRDGELILVPNSAIFSGVVTNRTAVGGFVQRVSVTFPRKVDLSQTSASMVTLLQRLPSVLDSPLPQLRIERVDADTWTACVSLWARTHDAAADVAWALAHAFPDATVITGPEPT